MGLLRWQDESDGAEGREGERRETEEEKEECKRKSWSCSAEPPYDQLRIELAAIRPVFYRRTYQIFSQALDEGVCVTVGGTRTRPVSVIYTVCSEQQVCGRPRVLLCGFVALLCWI